MIIQDMISCKQANATFAENLGVTLIGTLLGFVLAIIGQKLFEYFSKMNKLKQLIKTAKTEIDENTRVAEDALQNSNYIASNSNYYQFTNDVWQSVLNSGFLFEVSGKPYYTSFENYARELRRVISLEEIIKGLFSANPASAELQQLKTNRKSRFEEIIKLGKIIQGLKI